MSAATHDLLGLFRTFLEGRGALVGGFVAAIPDEWFESDDTVRVGIAPTYLSLEAVRPWITALDWTPGGLTDAADLRARLAPRRKAEQLSLF